MQNIFNPFTKKLPQKSPKCKWIYMNYLRGTNEQKVAISLHKLEVINGTLVTPEL